MKKTFTCKVCGKKFKAARFWAQTCSKNCRLDLCAVRRVERINKDALIFANKGRRK